VSAARPADVRRRSTSSSALVTESVRGPSTRPAAPNSDSPPTIEKNTGSGWKRSRVPTSTGYSTLSIRPMAMAPHATSTSAFTTDPVIAR
jgi:hypothetical protein